MAQSVEEIFNELIAEKEQQAALNELMPSYGFPVPSSTNPFIKFLKDINTQSQTGIWRLWLFIVAVAIRAQQFFFDEHKAEVTGIIANQVAATTRWYRSQMLAFQVNYLLFYVDDKFVYLVDDPDARIIIQCKVEKAAGVRIRVAKSDGAGGLMKLSNAEVFQAQSYVNQIRHADHDVYLFSFDPDTVRAVFHIHYDPLADLDQLKLDTKAAIKYYLSYLADNDFGGKIVLNKMVDALQALDAIKNPVPLEFLGRYGTLAFTDYLEDGEYRSNAGYAVLDEAYFDANTIWEPDL